jgi:Galactose-3-O-sulfotransferase
MVSATRMSTNNSNETTINQRRPEKKVNEFLEYTSQLNQLAASDEEATREKRRESEVIRRLAFKKRIRNPLVSSRMVLVVVTAIVTWLIQSMLYRYELLDFVGVPENTIRESHSTLPQQQQEESSSKTTWDLSNYSGPARAFPVYTYPFPCFPAEESNYLMLSTPAQEGILFQRPMKTGSTTVAGIVMRMAHRRKLPGTNACQHRAFHGGAMQYNYVNRTIGKSFLFSILRDPTKKAISLFFHFKVGVGQIEPTDVNFKRIMMRPENENVYIRDLAMRPMWEFNGKENKTKVIEEILSAYDFIAITERMDESLVVLKMLLSLDFEDIIYVKERSQGGFSNGPPDSRPCLYIVPSFLTPGMEEFFAGSKWAKQSQGDSMIYKAAYRSLDMTIDALGRKNVEQQVHRFQQINMKAQEMCESTVRSLCDVGGHRNLPINNTCYIWGEGCAHDCLDKFSMEPSKIMEK